MFASAAVISAGTAITAGGSAVIAVPAAAAIA
jgi:hypothetical protein